MNMKRNILKSLFFFALVTLLAIACKDRDAEKKIAQLEGRLAELEGKKAPAAVSPTPAAPAPETKPEGPLPVMEFETTEHDFATITEGDVVEYTYAFKNTGAAPLIIQGAQGSCGCTVPDWTKEPIPVGGKGFVKAKFDSNGKPNIQNKTVTVTANTWPKQTVLRFKAMVTPKAVSDAPVKK
jgi:poly(3-hydroxybutyrate) depolymerase